MDSGLQWWLSGHTYRSDRFAQNRDTVESKFCWEQKANDENIARDLNFMSMSQYDMKSGSGQMQPVGPVFHIDLTGLHKILEIQNHAMSMMKLADGTGS
jgi:hypothetical protein